MYKHICTYVCVYLTSKLLAQLMKSDHKEVLIRVREKICLINLN